MVNTANYKYTTRKIEDESQSTETPTSLMIKSLPSRCGPQELMDAINELGFQADYNFFYMPLRRPRTKPGSYGYAFINFASKERSLEFQRRMDKGELILPRRNTVVTQYAPSHLQSLESLMNHFKDTSASEESWGPMVKVSGSEVLQAMVSVGRSQKATAKSEMKTKEPPKDEFQDSNPQAASYAPLSPSFQNLHDASSELLDQMLRTDHKKKTTKNPAMISSSPQRSRSTCSTLSFLSSDSDGSNLETEQHYEIKREEQRFEPMKINVIHREPMKISVDASFYSSMGVYKHY